jgi:hypothetical protein
MYVEPTEAIELKPWKGALKKRDGIENHPPRSKLVTDDRLGVQAYELRCRRVVPGRSGRAAQAAERSPADSGRR